MQLIYNLFSLFIFIRWLAQNKTLLSLVPLLFSTSRLGLFNAPKATLCRYLRKISGESLQTWWFRSTTIEYLAYEATTMCSFCKKMLKSPTNQTQRRFTGATLSADKAGYKAGQGRGIGRCSSWGCSGGSYASSGGSGYSVNAIGHSQVPYDSIFKPRAPGSPGGGKMLICWFINALDKIYQRPKISSLAAWRVWGPNTVVSTGLFRLLPGSRGGAGGGHIVLLVGERLTVDGLVSANGEDARVNDAQSAGGSGGSVVFAASAFTGAGHFKVRPMFHVVEPERQKSSVRILLILRASV